MAKKGLDICIIDDEVVVCRRLEQYLGKSKHRVETFVDSTSAIERIGEKTFDIVVTDIRMDNINGMDVLNRVIEKGEHTLVIMITGYATIEIAREAQARGAFDFISKPFRPKDLKAAIDKAAASLEADGKT
jgi:DNA-binding NtrC family response regulator